MSQNFWADPPTAPPYVHADDRPYVEAFNRLCDEEGPGSTYRLHDELIPEPFLGPRDARLVILNKNPSLSTDETDPELHSRPGPYRDALLANLRSPGQPFPHLLSDEPFQSSHSGRWWRRTLKLLVEAAGDQDALAGKVLAVEFHGYHAHNYLAIPITLPSQRYNFELVRAALARPDTVVLLMRGRKAWEVAVPELSWHPNVLRGKSQNAAVSPGNIAGDFDRVLAAVRAGAP